jgi:hypothetical protein
MVAKHFFFFLLAELKTCHCCWSNKSLDSFFLYIDTFSVTPTLSGEGSTFSVLLELAQRFEKYFINLMIFRSRLYLKLNKTSLSR